MVSIISFDTKFGWISIKEEEKLITELRFLKSKKYNKNHILLKTKKKIINYTNKQRKLINVKYRLQGNKTQIKVWEEIRKIKYGKTKTYGEIGRKLKISPRYVGNICGKNKLFLIIPCHRVIRSDGKLGGFSGKGGLKLKKRLLNLEKN